MSAATSSADPQLRRRLGVWSATALVVSNMVGTGIFTSTGFMAGDLGSAGLILLAWAVGACFAFCGALVYSELAVNHPQSGGEYVYLTKAYGPSWGFMSGWVSFFAGFSAPVAAAALAWADYLAHFFPALGQSNTAFTLGSGDWTIHVGSAQLAACGLIGLFTLLNCLRIEVVARVQNSLTLIKVLVVAAFILLGILIGKGDWSHFASPAVRTSTAPLGSQFLVSLLWVMVGYSGWNAAAYVAGEIREPERTLPRALAMGTGLVAVMYLGLNLTFMYATPLESMKGVLRVGALSASNLFGPGIASAFAALMALAIMSTVNAMVTAGPRVYYAMAQNRAFPAFAAKVSPRSNTPVRAVLAQSACSMLLTFTSFPQLVVFIGFTLTIFTALAVGSDFVFRRGAWRPLAGVSFAYPLLPAAYCLLGLGTTVYGLIWQPKASIAALAVIGAGALVYHFRGAEMSTSPSPRWVVRLRMPVAVFACLVILFLAANAVNPVATQRAYLRAAAGWHEICPFGHGKWLLFRANDRLYDIGIFKPVVVTVQGGPMELDGRDLVTQSILLEGVWEPKITGFVKQDVHQGDVFIDVGAHVGYYSLIASRLVGDSGTVIAVEPNPPTIERLERNVRLNRARNIVIEKVACTDKETTLDLFQAPAENTGASSVSRASVRGSSGVAVRGVPLDAIVQSLNLKRVNFVKIDVEGAEMMVLGGMKNILASFHPIVEIEISDDLLKNTGSSADAVVTFIKSYGYVMRGSDGRDNFLWLPSGGQSK